MNYASAAAAFRAFLVNRWTLTPVFEGNHGEPSTDVPFLRVRVLGQTGTAREVGNTDGRSTEYRANAQVIAFVPAADDEEATLADIATRLDALLSLREIPTDERPLHCGVVEIGRAAPADEAGTWTSVIHRVSLTYDAKSGSPL